MNITDIVRHYLIQKKIDGLSNSQHNYYCLLNSVARKEKARNIMTCDRYSDKCIASNRKVVAKTIMVPVDL